MILLTLYIISKIKYKRSLMSTLAEIYLKLTKDKSSKKKAYKRLIKLKNKKEKPYFIPKNIRFKVSVFRSIFENTPI